MWKILVFLLAASVMATFLSVSTYMLCKKLYVYDLDIVYYSIIISDDLMRSVSCLDINQNYNIQRIFYYQVCY